MDYSSVNAKVKGHSVESIITWKDKVSDVNKLFAAIDCAAKPGFEGIDSVPFGTAGEFLVAEVN